MPHPAEANRCLNSAVVATHSCQRSRDTANNSISTVTQLKPRIDIDYLFRSRYQQLKHFILRRVANEDDAEELAQNTYIEALLKASSYKGLSRPDVWLFGIALNLVRNHRKKEANRQRVWEEAFLPEQIENIDNNPEREIENHQILDRLEGAMRRLPAEMQMVFDTVVIENRSYQEAATLVGVPTGTIRSRLSRSREKLKDAILA